MPTILPRLRNLLSILAAESEPLPVKEVADRLRVSKRTVFRELATIGAVLGGYDLEVGSLPGEGIVLQGLPQARTALLTDLGKLDRSDPADKRDRQDRLVLAVLQSPGQKLAAHADRFKVSVPTVSHDLDDIELWLAGRGLTLSRRPGSGIFIGGDEMLLRRAVLSLLHRLRESVPYPHPDILLDILDLSPELDPLLDWMTPQSLDALRKYLCVAAQRIMDGCALADAAAAPERREEFSPAADRLATILSETFNIPFSPAETAALELELAACRPNVPRAHRGKDDPSLSLIAGEMTTLFDPGRAPLLKMDDVLMEGLVNHLRTAIVRIRRRVELSDPMREQIARDYPDVMRRSRKACEALAPYGDWLPESEVSLFAAHFAAALLRLSEQTGRQRTARVGIICVHGIGSSYLLASQVKRALGARVVVEVGWHGDKEKWRQYDVLVSTTELGDAGLPVVVVPPIPGEGDLRRVEEALGGVRPASGVQEKTQGVFLDDLRKIEEVAAAARRILESFSLTPTPPSASLAELPLTAGRLFGKSEESAAEIAWELTAREAISTQVVPELRTVLLHCRTEGVDAPLFGVLRPNGGDSARSAGGGAFFTHPKLSRARSCVVMLLPAAASRELSEMMGALATALVEQEHFLETVQSGAAGAVRSGLERILGEFLFQFTVHRLKG